VYSLINWRDSKKLEESFVDGEYSISETTKFNRSGKTVISNVDIKMYADPESEYIQPIYELTDSDDSISMIIDAQQR